MAEAKIIYFTEQTTDNKLKQPFLLFIYCCTPLLIYIKTNICIQ